MKFDTVDNNLEHLLQELVRVHVLPDVPFELPPEGVELVKGNLTRLVIIEQLDDINDHQRRRMLSETALEFLGMNESDLVRADNPQASTA